MAPTAKMANKQKPRHLGRGLATLLRPIMPPVEDPSTETLVPLQDPILSSNKDLALSVRQLPVDSIHPNPYQPRSLCHQQQLQELADSIKATGLLQPILVRPHGHDYQVLAGQRRLLAARLAHASHIKAIVRPATDEQMAEIALIENIHRADLNPIERAAAYRNYMEAFSLTQAEAAERLGESRPAIANHLRLLELPQEIQEMLLDGRLSMGHARAILAVPTEQLRNQLANRALAGRLSVREVEELVRRYLGERYQRQTAALRPAHIIDLENQLTAHLGTRVVIETGKSGHRGRIRIEFRSLDEFERITDALGLGAADEVSDR